ncbi:CD276 antigen isoform 1-T1 [Clarias gariepinus]|uniref:V-set domain-containing T-cell activation inhibitor 1 n=1 Tax=Clarias gariepinus TaxID=13013 RepID=UPI00234CEE3C|nr:V-set domain-containing T-cell activation inhibitor 1 [Clarias gariepinus]
MNTAQRHRAGIRQYALLHTTVLFLSICCSYADILRVTVPSSRLVAARGHAVVLGCVFSPDFGPNPNISSLVVTWQRVENNHVVHSFYYERDQLDLQDSAYQKRTSLFVNKLSKGNASVRIENVGVKDAGRYLCTVSTSRGTDKASLQLDYGALYTEPRLTINVHSSDIMVQYETEGFPAPEVTWKGENGKNLSSHIQTSIQPNEETGLYYIKSSYTAPKTPLNFTFTLKNQLMQQYLHRPVSFTGEQTSCLTAAILAVVICLFLILIAAVLFWRYYRK